MAVRLGYIAAGMAGMLALSALMLSRCSNRPYRPGEAESSTIFTILDTPPTKLDPATSYYVHEALVIDNIYEPPLDYHYLKRPYQLVPLTATEMPVAKYFDREGRPARPDLPDDQLGRVEYTVRIRPGILYHDHPCFATNAQGEPLYRNLTARDLRRIRTVHDFPVKGTREATAEDYVRGVRRLADPRLVVNVVATFRRSLLGYEEYAQALEKHVEAERARRRAEGGGGYLASADEKARPIRVDYLAFACPGIEAVDRYTFKVALKRRYPQILYWMAMHFFAPIPQEALDFYTQGVLEERQLTLNEWPVSTGAFYLQEYRPHQRVILARNPRFRGEPYPSEGEPADRENGFLEDAGKPIPFLDRVVFTLEKETIPPWNKFLQGYYDYNAITPEAFDRTVNLSHAGEPSLSDDMARRGIRMFSDIPTRFYYLGFNMRDPVVGGFAGERRKLRLAISIALDYTEFLDIFLNGQGIAAQGPLPPGMFGARTGEEGVNPYTDAWDPRRKRAVRKPLGEAKRLLSEAGYSEGRGPDGRPLTLYLDHAQSGSPIFVSYFGWLRARMAMLGIRLEERGTELKRFREKLDAGAAQLFMTGWYADYPDAENFLFLFYGPNARADGGGGENSVNYKSPEYDRLFARMEGMENGPERQAVIDEMVGILRRDAPACWGYHPRFYTLKHEWYHNAKANYMSSNLMKYRRIDAALRVQRQREWNRPRTGPVLALEALFFCALLPVIARWQKREKEAA